MENELIELKKRVSVKGLGRVGVISLDDSALEVGGDGAYMLVFVIDGRARVSNGITLGANELMLLTKNEKATVESDDRARVFLIEFEYKAHFKSGRKFRHGKAGSFSLALIARMIAACDDLLGKLNQYGVRLVRSDAEETSAQIVKNSLELLLVELFTERKSVDEVRDSLVAKSGIGAAAARAIYDYLAMHVEESVSLQDIADELFFSVAYVKAVFKKYTGKTVFDCLAEMKTERAKKMLKDGMRVKDVAERLSYCNAAYFTAAFKKATGTTPTEFLRLDSIT